MSNFIYFVNLTESPSQTIHRIGRRISLGATLQMNFRGRIKGSGQIEKNFRVTGPDISLQLLDVMFSSSSIGVAILDRQGRFEAVNESLASINGIPSRSHIGKTLRQILGDAATEPEMVFEKALVTGKTVSQFHMVAQLPNRKETGHWLLTYRPLHSASKRNISVCAHVVEITEEIKLQTAIVGLIQRLQIAKIAARRQNKSHGQESDLHARKVHNSGTLFEECLSQARSISKVLGNHSILSGKSARNLMADSNDACLTHLQNASDSLYAGYPFPEPDVPVQVLTARETAIMKLLLNGKTNKEVASTISISHRTVEAHRSKIMLKLRVNSLAELVRYAVRNNLVAV